MMMNKVVVVVVGNNPRAELGSMAAEKMSLQVGSHHNYTLYYAR